MKFPRASLHIQRATGICVGESRVLVSVCQAARRGPQEIDAFEVPVGPGGPLEALYALARDPRIGGRVALGFDPRREFSATLRLSAEESALPVGDLLTARLGTLEGGLVGAMRPLRMPGGTWANVTAVAKKSASTALSAFAEWEPDRLLLLPVTHELQRVAAQLTRSPRKWRTRIRVLRNQRRGMAILSTGTHALAWRLFPWADADPVGSIESAVLMLLNHAHEELGLDAVDGLLLHCAPEPEDLAAACSEALNMPVIEAAPVIFDEPAIASVLAAGALAHKLGDVNLFEELRPKPGLKRNAPLVTIAALCVLMFSTASLLYREASRTSAAAARLESKVQNDARGRPPRTQELERARELLATEVDRAHSFAVDRVLWAPLLKELPSLMPPNLTLTGFDGRNPLKGFGEEHQSSGARRAILQGEVPFEGDASSPPEVGMLTGRLVQSAVFQKSFPEVTGAKVRMKPGLEQDLAKIMVLCMPRGG